MLIKKYLILGILITSSIVIYRSLTYKVGVSSPELELKFRDRND